MAKIKICGLKRVEDIDYINELKPDYIGFILSKGFKRSIDFDTALLLKSKLDKNIKAVGVFVDDNLDFINGYLDKNIIDIVQLHGEENVEFCQLIKSPVIKVLKPNQFSLVKDYESFVDAFLFDSGTGTGKVFDWSTLPKTKKPFFLAGGLEKNNLKLAISKVNPYALDMSSSVETDGFKDYKKIKEVIDIVRDINE